MTTCLASADGAITSASYPSARQGHLGKIPRNFD